MQHSSRPTGPPFALPIRNEAVVRQNMRHNLERLLSREIDTEREADQIWQSFKFLEALVPKIMEKIRAFGYYMDSYKIKAKEALHQKQDSINDYFEITENRGSLLINFAQNFSEFLDQIKAKFEKLETFIIGEVLRSMYQQEAIELEQHRLNQTTEENAIVIEDDDDEEEDAEEEDDQKEVKTICKAFSKKKSHPKISKRPPAISDVQNNDLVSYDRFQLKFLSNIRVLPQTPIIFFEEIKGSQQQSLVLSADRCLYLFTKEKEHYKEARKLLDSPISEFILSKATLIVSVACPQEQQIKIFTHIPEKKAFDQVWSQNFSQRFEKLQYSADYNMIYSLYMNKIQQMYKRQITVEQAYSPPQGYTIIDFQLTDVENDQSFLILMTNQQVYQIQIFSIQRQKILIEYLGKAKLSNIKHLENYLVLVEVGEKPAILDLKTKSIKIIQIGENKQVRFTILKALRLIAIYSDSDSVIGSDAEIKFINFQNVVRGNNHHHHAITSVSVSSSSKTIHLTDDLGWVTTFNIFD